jgi:signal transduction histidine kinase
VFVVESLPGLARKVVVADQWFTVAVAVGVAALCVGRVAGASPPVRRTLAPLTAAAVLFSATVAARGLVLADRPLEDPAAPVFRGVFLVQCLALVVLAATLVWGLLRTRLQQVAVARIASNLGDAPTPGSLESELARTVGDPDLRIAYWLPEAGRYVDASGTSLEAPVAGPGRALTTLVRGEQRVAVVTHAPGVPAIESAMGPALTLALDNERLQAHGLAQLEELRASRARIVETGDLERRHLERDLHDGAQQRLLAASYEIRLATAAATSAGEARTAANLSSALDGVLAALEELRELAQGLFPAVLGEAGLGAALTSLADTSPVVVDTRLVTTERLPAAVELAAYLLVVEAVDDAHQRGASRVGVRAARVEGVLVVTVADDGPGPLATLVRSADRVGALGGTLETGREDRRAVIPCA